MSPDKSFDVAVVGAGVFGAWTAYSLAQSRKSVVLLDAHGPANSRASSGGESRIIRIGYGPNELYSRWAMRSLALWKEFFGRVGRPLFDRTGVLWIASEKDVYTRATFETLTKLGARCERLSRPELEKRYPQMAFGKASWGLLELDSGALMARRAVQAVVEEAMQMGVVYRNDAVVPPQGRGLLKRVQVLGGEAIQADIFVFACGAWLGRLFDEILGKRIFPTRQEVYFFGVPPGDTRFAPPNLPIWLCLSDGMYGFPNLEGRGVKLACDRHGPPFDPDTGERIATKTGAAAARRYLAQRFPALRGAPILETRVCQYENTSNGHFVIDRHPAFENLWMVGGGSGHGFKHGPALGEYVAALLTEGGKVEQRFSLATKAKVQRRVIY